MGSPIEQIGRANRILSSVAKKGAKETKQRSNRWRRRRIRQDIEADLPKYKGWLA